MHGEIVQYIIFGVAGLYALYRVSVPIQASDKKPSRSLTGIYVCLVFIFASVAADTINDRATPPVQVVATSTSKAKGRRTVRRPTKPSRGSTRSRTVIKEKYFILFGALLVFAVLYVVSHRQNKPVIQGIMAVRKLDPYAHEDQVISAAVDILHQTPQDKETRNWFVRVVLAKKGVQQTTDGAIEEQPEEVDLASIQEPPKGMGG